MVATVPSGKVASVDGHWRNGEPFPTALAEPSGRDCGAAERRDQLCR